MGYQNSCQPNKLIIHCCYHKVATGFFTKIFKNIAREFNWNFQDSLLGKLKPETNIFLQHDSRIDLAKIPSYVGSHIIRDPRDMIISGYFYHLWCAEKWCHEKKPKYDNRSYQELLNSVSQEEGIALEIHRVKWSIKDMLTWDYSNPNIIEIKLEDLAKDEKSVMTQIFQHYGFHDHILDKALSIYEKYTFEKIARRKRGEEKKQGHFRKGVSGDWKNHFTAEHKKLFKEMYPGVLVKLSYEQDDNW